MQMVSVVVMPSQTVLVSLVDLLCSIVWASVTEPLSLIAPGFAMDPVHLTVLECATV